MSILDQYYQNGFYIVPKMFDRSHIQIVVENLKKTFDDQLVVLNLNPQENIYASMKLLHKRDIERYKKTLSALWRKLSIYDLLHHVNIRNFLTEIFAWQDFFMPGGQVIHIMSDSLKIPEGYFGAPIHQDYPSVQGSLDGCVIWIPLVDIDKNNYPMEIIPGSHKNGVLPSFESNDKNWVVKPEAYDESAFIPIECKAGDMVLMSYFTVHRSSVLGDDRLRLACSTRYDNADEKTFIERSYPTAYIRSVHRALIK